MVSITRFLLPYNLQAWLYLNVEIKKMGISTYIVNNMHRLLFFSYMHFIVFNTILQGFLGAQTSLHWRSASNCCRCMSNLINVYPLTIMIFYMVEKGTTSTLFGSCRGLMYVLFFSKWLLPDSEARSLHDEVLVGLQVPKGSKHTGRTGTRCSTRFWVVFRDVAVCGILRVCLRGMRTRVKICAPLKFISSFANTCQLVHCWLGVSACQHLLAVFKSSAGFYGEQCLK